MSREFNILCSCRHSYIGQTFKTVVIWEAEQKCLLRLGNTGKSAVTMHDWNTGHAINFEETTLLYRSSSWRERALHESMEIQFCTHAINEDGMTLSKAWLPSYTLRSNILDRNCKGTQRLSVVRWRKLTSQHWDCWRNKLSSTELPI